MGALPCIWVFLSSLGENELSSILPYLEKEGTMPRVLLANLAQETCSFVPSRHTLEDFRRYYLYTGQEILDKLAGGGMEVSAMIATAAEEGIELVPTLATYGGTGGPVTADAYRYLKEEILAGARRHAGTVDGAILALHGGP